MKKITLLFSLFALAFSFEGFAQFGCGSGVVITDGYTATGITTPGTAGPEDWNTNPTVTCGGTNNAYWDDDVYLFTYTAGATDEEISMTTFSRNSWNGLGIFATCTGTALDGCLDTVGTTGTNTTKTVTANISAGQTVYIASGQWGTPNGLDFDVTAFSAVPLVNPPSCTTLSSPLDGDTAASLNGDITWNAATGAATDYLLEVGTTTGGTEVFSGQVGNVTTFNVGALSGGTIYYVTITPSNSNGAATGCTEYSFTTLTPAPGDFISNAIAFTPSAEGTACNTAAYPFSYDFTILTDSGLDGSCNGTNTGKDIFLSWTATSDALIWNDGSGGNPGIVIRDAGTGNEITCVTTFAANDFVLTGWTVGQDLILQVYDYGAASVNPVNFCLAEFTLPDPPSNDTCGTAETVPSSIIGAEVWVTGTTVGNTASGITASCGNNGSGRDTWFTVTVPTNLIAGESYVIATQADPAGSTLTDTVLAIYSDCAGTQIACNDDFNGGFSQVTLVEGTNITPGQVLYLRVNEFAAAAARVQGPQDGTFQISAATAAQSLSSDEFNAQSLFSYYPNPVNDNLTLKAQKEINNVSVYNMLGQEVYRNAPNSVNNTVDMSNLQSGAYFVKVTIDNVTETIKVIKK